ncbi:SCO family protein [Pleomorphomonas sp. PLEO]|uniref:SCO family protein n=1 Tax=Pleomorphomonas sp. PLEO TaxID=3239306 RepID=UPI00351F3289
MKALRIIVWVLVAVLFGATGWLVFGGRLPFMENTSIAAADIGGPFSLVDMNGNAVTDKTFAGRPHVIFFGYTHCPDVCPTTLGEYAALKERLGTDAAKVDLLFVTVDPERDTPAVLKDYLSSFGDIVVGLSGSREQIDAAIKAFRVYARKVPGTDGDYGMDHTASSFMFGADGRFHGTIAYMEDQDSALQKLKTLIAGS